MTKNISYGKWSEYADSPTPEAEIMSHEPTWTGDFETLLHEYRGLINNNLPSDIQLGRYEFFGPEATPGWKVRDDAITTAIAAVPIQPLLAKYGYRKSRNNPLLNNE